MGKDIIEHFKWPWEKKSSGGGSSCPPPPSCNYSPYKNKINNWKNKYNRERNNVQRLNTQLNIERNRVNGVRSGANALGKKDNVDVNSLKSLYNNFFTRSNDALINSSMVVDNQNDLLSRQRQLLHIKNDKFKNINKDYQNVLSGITMNDRVMDYDLSDSGSNVRLQRLMYILTLVLIITCIIILFLRKFSML